MASGCSVKLSILYLHMLRIDCTYMLEFAIHIYTRGWLAGNLPHIPRDLFLRIRKVRSAGCSSLGAGCYSLGPFKARHCSLWGLLLFPWHKTFVSSTPQGFVFCQHLLSLLGILGGSSLAAAVHWCCSSWLLQTALRTFYQMLWLFVEASGGTFDEAVEFWSVMWSVIKWEGLDLIHPFTPSHPL